MWFKEELKTREEIIELLEWIEEEDIYSHEWTNVNKEEIIQNILDSNSIQFENPSLSYSIYLIFEYVYIEPWYSLFLDFEPNRLPLWVYHNCGNSLQKKLKNTDCSMWYQYLKENDENLDLLGEFGAFEIWLSKQIKQVTASGIWYELINEIIDPNWKENIGENSKWNKKYEPEDWMYHAVL